MFKSLLLGLTLINYLILAFASHLVQRSLVLCTFVLYPAHLTREVIPELTASDEPPKVVFANGVLGLVLPEECAVTNF